MPSDFTVIQAVRQHFGDNREYFEINDELEAPFVGAFKDFSFSCPNVRPGEFAVLQFESRNVTAGIRNGPRNIIRINGVDIPGGITPNATTDAPEGGKRLYYWKSHTLIVPANILRRENVLRIESVSLNSPSLLDNFLIDNIVIFYKIP